MKFTANYNDRTTKALGLDVYDDGIKIGESDSEKGAYWSAWKYKDEFYLMLSDEYEDCWKVNEAIAMQYVNVDIEPKDMTAEELDEWVLERQTDDLIQMGR